MGSKRNLEKSLATLFIQYTLGLGIGIIIIFLLTLVVYRKFSIRSDLSLNELFTIQFISVIVVIVLSITLLILLSFSFMKKIKNNMNSLLSMASAIEEKNLDICIEKSKIKEINLIIDTMDDMRIGLKNSLEKEWKFEQYRREQISALAHDLKTPLTIVQGYLELLSYTDVDKKQKQYINLIQESSDEIKQYIKLLIDMSKLESEYIVEEKEIKLTSLLENIVVSMKPLGYDKKVSLTFSENNPKVIIKGDEVMLRRAFSNIISNAIDFSPRESNVYIDVEIIKKEVSIVITDFGCGFSNEALVRGKEQFYTGEKSRSNSMHYGMGLYISSNIIDLHHGNIELRNSNKTKGAEVTIKLPIYSVSAEEIYEDY